MSSTLVAHDLNRRTRTGDVLINENVDFKGLLLSDTVLFGLEKSGFTRPSPIQLKAIPLGRCGLDLIVQAKSGTGKTCVFSVIALEGIQTESFALQVLVLAPTREIAIQIWDVICSIGQGIASLKCHTFIGGMPIPEDRQKLKKCHIAVGTPGRIKQLIESGMMKTDSVRMFILDEADKLLEESFQEQINWIYSSLPENKQMLALSATYPEYLAQHLTAYMRNPTFLRLNISDPALLGIKQFQKAVAFHPLPNKVFNNKTKVVTQLLSSVNFQQCLIFSNLQTRAQNMADVLTSQGWPTVCIAGSYDQKDRNEAMSQLKTYKCRVLISTDLTSRGIDADKVNLVINLDVPKDHETYLHRIGRAGRFGTFGAAVTIVSAGQEQEDLAKVEKKCNTHIKELPDPIPSTLTKSEGNVNLDDMVSSEQINTDLTRKSPVKNKLELLNRSTVTERADQQDLNVEKSSCVKNIPSVGGKGMPTKKISNGILSIDAQSNTEKSSTDVGDINAEKEKPQSTNKSLHSKLTADEQQSCDDKSASLHKIDERGDHLKPSLVRESLENSSISSSNLEKYSEKCDITKTKVFSNFKPADVNAQGKQLSHKLPQENQDQQESPCTFQIRIPSVSSLIDHKKIQHPKSYEEMEKEYQTFLHNRETGPPGDKPVINVKPAVLRWKPGQKKQLEEAIEDLLSFDDKLHPKGLNTSVSMHEKSSQTEDICLFENIQKFERLQIDDQVLVKAKMNQSPVKIIQMDKRVKNVMGKEQISEQMKNNSKYNNKTVQSESHSCTSVSDSDSVGDNLYTQRNICNSDEREDLYYLQREENVQDGCGYGLSDDHDSISDDESEDDGDGSSCDDDDDDDNVEDSANSVGANDASYSPYGAYNPWAEPSTYMYPPYYSVPYYNPYMYQWNAYQYQEQIKNHMFQEKMMKNLQHQQDYINMMMSQFKQ